MNSTRPATARKLSASVLHRSDRAYEGAFFGTPGHLCIELHSPGASLYPPPVASVTHQLAVQLVGIPSPWSLLRDREDAAPHTLARLVENKITV